MSIIQLSCVMLSQLRETKQRKKEEGKGPVQRISTMLYRLLLPKPKLQVPNSGQLEGKKKSLGTPHDDLTTRHKNNLLKPLENKCMLYTSHGCQAVYDEVHCDWREESQKKFNVVRKYSMQSTQDCILYYFQNLSLLK